MYRVNSKAILFITAFIWAACILIMGSVLLNSGEGKQGTSKRQAVSKTEDVEEPRAISIIEKATTPFDMPVLNFERTAAYRACIFPDQKAFYIRDGTKVGFMYSHVLMETDKLDIIAGRYCKGVGYG